MTIYSLNYGKFDTYKEANAIMKKKFPNGTIFGTDDNKYTVKVYSGPNVKLFEQFPGKDANFWISEKNFR